MKTRLLWLVLLCMALLFALGMLVVGAEDLPPPPAQAQYLLPPLDVVRDLRGAAFSEIYRFLPAPLWANLRSVCPVYRQTLFSDANGIPLSGGGHMDAAYAASHFSDEAG